MESRSVEISIVGLNQPGGRTAGGKVEVEQCRQDAPGGDFECRTTAKGAGAIAAGVGGPVEISVSGLDQPCVRPGPSVGYPAKL